MKFTPFFAFTTLLSLASWTQAHSYDDDDSSFDLYTRSADEMHLGARESENLAIYRRGFEAGFQELQKLSRRANCPKCGKPIPYGTQYCGCTFWEAADKNGGKKSRH